MTFIVTLIALLIERFFDWGHLRQWHWYHAWLRLVIKRFPTLSPYLQLAGAILPVLLLVFCVGLLIQNWMYGFLSLLLQLVILIYCLGPKDLWADAFTSINALQGDAQAATDRLKIAFGLPENTDASSLHRHLLNAIFVEANRRVFAVIFWYAILGIVGALLYRLVTITVDAQSDSTTIAHGARETENILDWLPTRLLTFLYALGGHFVQVLACWRKKVLANVHENEQMLIDCGRAALGYDETLMPENGAAESAAVSLIDRAFIIMLVIVAILVFLL
jgi:AmpE protein